MFTECLFMAEAVLRNPETVYACLIWRDLTHMGDEIGTHS